MANSRRQRLEREIDRDARMTLTGYARELVAAALAQLQRASLAGRCPEPGDLFDEVEAITRKFKNLHARLNDARINRRGDRDHTAPAPVELPQAVRPYAHHGEYLGAYPSVEAFAHACLDTRRPELWTSYVDLTRVGIDLHLGGRYWTYDAGGATHVFAVPATSSGAPEPDRSDDPESEPPQGRREPERARLSLKERGCGDDEAETAMANYVGRFVSGAAFAWHYLSDRTSIPRWLLPRVDTRAMAEDWAERGGLWIVPDPQGGAHIFAFGDVLAAVG